VAVIVSINTLFIFRSDHPLKWSEGQLASRSERSIRNSEYGDGLDSPGLSFTGLGEGAKRSQPSYRRQIH